MRRHHPLVRVTHWVNVVALAIMVGSGLRIFNAHPGFARIGERFCCYPFEGRAIPGWLTFGGWLAGARNWHFAMMWLLVLNGLVYLAFIWLHGEWRDLVPRRHDPRDAWEMIKFYLFVRRDHPRQGKHNVLQKLVYFSFPLIGILAVLTGLAIWKPVQLAPLTALFGGYVWARYWHFVVMLALVVLSAGHVFMVMSVDPYSLRAMITGGYDPALSPEERNARPFLHLGPRPRRGPAPEPARSPVGGTNGPGPGPGPEKPADAREPALGSLSNEPAPEPEPGAPADARRAASARTATDARMPEAARAPEDGRPAGARTPEAARIPDDGRSADAPIPEAARMPEAARVPEAAASPARPVPAGSPDANAPDVAPQAGREES